MEAMNHYLLESESLLKLEILTALFKNQKRGIGFPALAGEINYNAKSTRLLLPELIRDIRTYGLEKEVHIEVKDFTIYSKFSHHYNPAILECHYVQQSVGFCLLEEILLGKFQSVNIFADKHNWSRSYVYRRMDILKLLLKKYHLTLDFMSSSLIKGEEGQIRYFYFCFYWTNYQESHPALGMMAPDVKMYIERLMKKNEIKDYFFAHRLHLLIQIQRWRLRRKQVISAHSFEIIDNPLFSREEFHRIFFEPIMLQTQLSTQEQEKEEAFCYFLMSTTMMYESKNELAVPVVFRLIKSEPAIVGWIEEFQKFFELELDLIETGEIVTNLYYIHQLGQHLKGDFDGYFHETKVTIFKTQHATMYDLLIKYFVRLTSLECGFFAQFKERNKYIFLCYTMLIVKILNAHRPKLKAILLSKTNSYHSQMNHEKIQAIYGHMLEMTQELTASVDVIITDYPLSDFPEEARVFNMNTRTSFYEGSNFKEFLAEAALEKYISLSKDNKNIKNWIEYR
ncbi:MAG: helix-turn-helix domain-containing protein [Lactobacillales bacterium]|jgi:hypothetical protein|nr:helix-turn-helix domain-containing protein [Lactobacillales bacterium]